MSGDTRTRRILFISGSDFKEKSIQVIRKTPEAYAAAGWDVHYVVGRDNSKGGDYFYEKIFNPDGLKVYRFILPLERLHGAVNHALWKAVWFRIRTIILVLKLMWLSRKIITTTGDFDVIYGYEIPGVLASRLLRFLGYGRKAKFIIRFQGVLHVKEWLRLGQKIRTLTNPEAITALRTKADMTIMTNDGSQGLEVLRKLNAPENKVLFFVNGVDKPALDPQHLQSIQQNFYRKAKWNFLSISRLDAHKRIDRGIRIIEALVKKFGINEVHYTVLGGGVECKSLQQLIVDCGLENFVTLVGPVNHKDVHYHLHSCDFLISMYTSSNVGNPLLEAIRHTKPVITLNNGDTGDWIQHKYNGLIYNVNDEVDLNDNHYLQIATDIKSLVNDQDLMNSLHQNLKKTESEKLWTWRERFEAELREVNHLIQE